MHKTIRLTLISFLITNILFLVLYWFVANNALAQQIDGKNNPDLMKNEAPWGLMIVFAEGTTITEANHLRLDYNLELSPMGYRDDNGRGYHYNHPDDSLYPEFASVFYYNTDCVFTPKEGKALCPPITPISAIYKPVSEDIEVKLLINNRVAQFDNRNDPVFFIFKMGIEFIKIIPDIYHHIMYLLQSPI